MGVIARGPIKSKSPEPKGVCFALLHCHRFICSTDVLEYSLWVGDGISGTFSKLVCEKQSE